MSYLVVASWDANNRVTEETRADTVERAEKIVSDLQAQGFTKAFYTDLPPSSGPVDWIADPNNKTVTVDKPPGSDFKAINLESLGQLLVDLGVLTQDQLNGTRG